MSRFRRYTHSMVSGYVMLAANTLYTLASVPLALSYLSEKEFGLWSVVTPIGGYILLIDFGMGASVARILIDYKDRRAGGEYGGLVQTAALVGVAQGLLIFLTGAALAFVLGPLLKVDPALQRDFTWLMLGQCAALALAFAARLFMYILTAHQRYDVTNYASVAFFAANYAVMWFCFARGLGVFSYLWAQILTTPITVVANGVACARLGFLPRRGEWGRPSWARFRELFTFGQDIFLYSLGGQLINASQALLLTRFIGLDAAAVWNVCTRTYQVVSQMIYRIFDFSSPALAEMMVQGDRSRLFKRFKQIVVLSASLSLVAGALFALCNSPFVTVWTSGKMGRPATLSVDTVTNLAALATRLNRPSTADGVSRFLRGQLSPETQARLAQYHGGADPKLRQLLVQDLNRVIKAGPFYEAGRFAKVTLSPETLDLLAQHPRGEEVARLNRLLLLDAYPAALTRRQVAWSPLNDLLLAVWLVICVSLHAHTGLVGQTKRLEFMRYIFFIEGLAFVSLTALLHRWGGIPVMLGVSIACSLAFSFLYGLHRTRAYFNLSWRELAGWHRAPLILLLWLTPVAVATWWLTRNWPPLPRLVFACAVVGAWSLVMLARRGLDKPLQGEVLDRSPVWSRRLLARMMGLKDAGA